MTARPNLVGSSRPLCNVSAIDQESENATPARVFLLTSNPLESGGLTLFFCSLAVNATVEPVQGALRSGE